MTGNGKIRHPDSPSRVPPHDLDIERSVIGALLVSENAVEVVTELLAPEDFYSEIHRVIYRACLQLWHDGEKIDQLTLSDKLRGDGEFEKIGGRPYIFQIVESVPMAANAKRHAEILRDLSLHRQIIEAGTAMAESGFDTERTGADLLDESEQIVYGISREGNHAQVFTPTSEIAEEELRKWELRQASDEQIVGLSSGFPDLDRIFLGFEEENIVILAARTGMGKTSMALSMIQNIAIREKEPVAMFSLEMSKNQLVNRLIAMESGVPSELIATGNVEFLDEEKVIEAGKRVKKSPIFINDTGGMSVASMRPKIRRLSSALASRGTPLRLVVVDYVGLMRDDLAAKEGREKEIAAISRGLKQLARELQLPFLVLAQFSRKADFRGDNRPQISDLRDSGSLEQDADKILMIHREDYYDPDTDEKGIAEIIVGKHRNGPQGVVKLAWLEKLARFAALQIGGI